MAVTPLVEHAQKMPDPQRHAIGFFNTQTDCDAAIQELISAGLALRLNERIVFLLSGGEDRVTHRC